MCLHLSVFLLFLVEKLQCGLSLQHCTSLNSSDSFSTSQSNLILLSQTCPNQLNDVSSSDLWFQDLWDCFNKLLGSDRLRFFSLFLQLSKWELLSCMMIQCFILSAFNICLTNALYVLSVETSSVVCGFLTQSWLIGCSHKFPSWAFFKNILSQRKQNSFMKGILITLQMLNTELSAKCQGK